MRILKLASIKSNKKPQRVFDSIQAAVEKEGRNQIKQIIEKGLSFRIVTVL